jgi:hypothetical protein
MLWLRRRLISILYVDTSVEGALSDSAQDSSKFVQILAGIAVGSEEDLGLESTHELVSLNNKLQHKMKLGDEYYTTDQNLGRPTRVWEPWTEDKSPGVTKDLWVDAESPSESDILQAILADMENCSVSDSHHDPDERQYSLTKIMEWGDLLSKVDLNNGQSLDQIASVFGRRRTNRKLDHYRVVFGQVGVASVRMSTLKGALAALRDAAFGS